MNTSVRSLLIGATLILSCISASAQHIVKGKVADSVTKEPEPGAVVQVFAGEAKNENLAGYALSDSLGCFSIKLRTITEADYFLKVINMGRITEERTFVPEGESTDFGTILLQDDVQALQSASVAAARPLIKMEADKISYDVENDVDSKASTVLDMLRKVPMVTVDGQDNITVNGSSSFVVYVDGKPNPMLSSNPSQIFKAMPASAVKGIEVISNPGARYDAEGTGGVLNLIIARSENGASAIPDGISGSIYAGADTRTGANGGLYANARKGKFSVGVNGYAGNSNIKGLRQFSTYKTSDGMLLKETADGVDQKGSYTFGNLTASYEIDTLNLISANVALRKWGGRQIGPWDAEASMAGAPVYSYDGSINAENKSNGLNASIDWQHSFKANKARMTTLSYRFASTPFYSNMEDRRSNPVGISVFDRKVISDNCNQEHTFQGDYTTPIAPGHTVSTGVKYIFRDNNATNKEYNDLGAGYVLVDSPNGKYTHYNHIGAAYVEYAGSFGMFSLKGGLRYEHTFVDVRFDNGNKYDSNYDNLVPDLSLQYNLGATSNIGLTYNMRIFRPGINYLNPFVNRTFHNSISYGNSDIEPEKKHNIALKYNSFSPKFMVSAGLNYRYGEGGIESYRKFGPDPENPAVNVIQTTYGNIVDSHSFGFNAFFNWNPVKDTRIYANAELDYDHFNSKVLGQENHGWCPDFVIGAQQTLPYDIRLSANVFVNGRSYNLQGWRSGFNGAALSVSRNFFKEKLGVTIQGFSNFSMKDLKIELYTNGDGVEVNQKVYIPLKSLSLQLTYNFGKGNVQVKKTQRSITNDDVIDAQKGSATAAGGSGMDSQKNM